MKHPLLEEVQKTDDRKRSKQLVSFNVIFLLRSKVRIKNELIKRRNYRIV